MHEAYINGPTGMSLAGRAFLNPQKLSEVWVNVGWDVKDCQRWLEWSPVLSVSAEEYEQVMAAVRKEFEETPFGAASEVAMARFFKCCTLGITVMRAQQKIQNFNTRIEKALQKFPNVKLCVVDRGSEANGMWVDQRGSPMMLNRSNARQVGGRVMVDKYQAMGGPPMGYNIVFEVGHQVEGWPQVQMRPAVPQPQTM
uniref:Uncharacterized protein n=1 Tax=Chromera velia CCMP2878 TaxID=1169474 RepID=A0A0G4HMJ0_9ALVE|eukprot:Cvel_29114.t1-p1 / transcript=Cvel_29114.t1 / gene=Cvel_29114 / organism=Chromera_velia_CCMP2878 / gene_product=hypothetical protein / transcript_product=hypothetical protein / location=Cvel_scaffold3930:8612-9202(+) / protein_length=197 / sequence_SO=supercontig / SO=protein_coding / is_pseudo=false